VLSGKVQSQWDRRMLADFSRALVTHVASRPLEGRRCYSDFLEGASAVVPSATI
jgi:hypothetical protein